ncbi:ABC transporter substrate-binding protein [Nocardiopsis algeriensis]|uniref:NitT/TauT family transport system substrate-binding protein n=1 Tax=Nocardiopsis algeriensis TaxID=1478215 RepID=A0A841IUE6_9ACTN|nr:ABC transporter substrate-binding protein [Nocardiopsis algeriensis]MBB6121870.1 NitT/TauT family transport system substrate-binding protein [Nocardiopsis algeriensis]
MTFPTTRRHLGAAAATAAVLLTAACGGTAEGDQTPVATVIDDERCAANEEAGKLTYISGYFYQASVTQLEVFAAESLGYFDAVCLDVEIQGGTGDVMANAQLVSAGTAHFTALSNEAEVVQASEADHNIIGIATYGHVPISILLTSPEVEDLKELEGQIMGHQSMTPAPLEAMLISEGVDLDKIEQVDAGYDPSILPRDEVQALTAFRSNEPHQLAAMGEEYKEWLPEEFGVVGSFGVMTTSPEFAEANPTVVEDFLRALAKASDYCQGEGNAEECVGYAAELDESGTYDAEHNAKVWATESELVRASTPDDAINGYIDLNLTEAEVQNLVDNGALESVPDLEPLFDPRYLEAVHVAGDVLWSSDE